MKKLYFIPIFWIFSTAIVHGYCSDYTSSYQGLVDTKKQQIINAKRLADITGVTTYSNSLENELVSLESRLQTAQNEYQKCLQDEKNSAVFQKGYTSYNAGKYEDAISYFNQYLQMNTDTSDTDNQSARKNLVLSYDKLGNAFLNKKDYKSAINNFLEAIKLDNRDITSLWGLGICYFLQLDYDNALNYYKEGLRYATDSDTIKALQDGIETVEKTKKESIDKKNAPTDDPLSYLQYYLKFFNIPDAWGKVGNTTNQVIVAVIDDGININHPDLANSIWSDPNAKYGDSKIKNFVGDTLPSNLPAGEHGTMVAGIIGATQNNKEGIAGIAKNVKLMPLRVFNTDGGATSDSIIKAMNYAIDNGANIINLSLGKSQFAYDTSFDTVIKRAHDKGVVVVIAAGNGDLLTNQTTGVNLTNNPMSPVCNNGGNNKYSIGVYAGDKDGYRTNWTNYGNCTSFMAPGVDIISTSISKSQYGDNYNAMDGTSFSAPMMAGIVALGFNKYGQISPDMVFDSLQESLTKNSVGNFIVDASKYLDIIGQKIGTKQKIEADLIEAKRKADADTNRIKVPVDKWFSKAQTKYGAIDNLDERKQKFINLQNALLKYKGRLTGDKQLILEYLTSLVEKEISFLSIVPIY